MRGDRLGDALAPGQARSNELAGIPLVDSRTGRADRLAAVAAGDVQDAAGFGRAVVDGYQLAGSKVDGVDAAA
jgi:hypothetical protein